MCDPPKTGACIMLFSVKNLHFLVSNPSLNLGDDDFGTDLD